MATIDISFTVESNAKAAAFRDDFCAHHSYQETINGEPNPESKAAFFKRKIGEYIKECVKAHRVNTAADSARQTAIASAESGVVLT